MAERIGANLLKKAGIDLTANQPLNAEQEASVNKSQLEMGQRNPL